jgi:hypothetical protein
MQTAFFGNSGLLNASAADTITFHQAMASEPAKTTTIKGV